MTHNMDRYRIAVILLFTITFTLVGTFAPVVYASHVPQSQVIEVHEFTAQDTTTNSDTHYICFDRTVQEPSSAETFTELYLLTEDDQRVEIQSRTNDRYFQSGRKQVVTPLSLPDDLAEGEYRYVIVAKFGMANGRVERTFAFKSEPFIISENANAVSSQEEAIERCK